MKRLLREAINRTDLARLVGKHASCRHNDRVVMARRPGSAIGNRQGKPEALAAKLPTADADGNAVEPPGRVVSCSCAHQDVDGVVRFRGDGKTRLPIKYGQAFHHDGFQRRTAGTRGGKLRPGNGRSGHLQPV
ncbi:hypothetical protein FG486_12030 [Sphingomonas ursincola]|uniref:Uncharacterized protein n=1 Tax=Sphingomonas ursincola TaxID=56361 RepID=A0A7V8U9G7_9SPHN|nr:hypothetical protein [Sphingomonas ursincola]